MIRIGLFVNDPTTERPRFTTTLLAQEALRRGHEVLYISVEDFSYRPDDCLHVHTHPVPVKKYTSVETVHAALQKSVETGSGERISVRDLDVLMLRNDPAAEGSGAWAAQVGIVFGQEAVRQGVLVLSDPGGLSQATNKLYFQRFPAELRPKTLISKSADDIREFVQEQNGKVVLKPLQGSGGQSVFLVREDENANLRQMIEAVSRDGYVIAQEYLPAAAAGDVRFFLMNGEPLVVGGKYAAFRRVGAKGDMRSNMHAGGAPEKVKVDDNMLRIASLVRPMLMRDGMFLVGLDIAGDKLMEINVFSPGGLYSAQQLQDARFAQIVVDAIERKVATATDYPKTFTNAQLAVL